MFKFYGSQEFDLILTDFINESCKVLKVNPKNIFSAREEFITPRRYILKLCSCLYSCPHCRFKKSFHQKNHSGIGYLLESFETYYENDKTFRNGFDNYRENFSEKYVQFELQLYNRIYFYEMQDIKLKLSHGTNQVLTNRMQDIIRIYGKY